MQEVLFNLLEQGFSVVTGLHGESALLQRQTLSDRSFEYTLLFELTHCLSKMIWLSRQRLQAFLLVLKCFAGRTAANITYEHLLHLTWWLVIVYSNMTLAFLLRREKEFVVGIRQILSYFFNFDLSCLWSHCSHCIFVVDAGCDQTLDSWLFKLSKLFACFRCTMSSWRDWEGTSCLGKLRWRSECVRARFEISYGLFVKSTLFNWKQVGNCFESTIVWLLGLMHARLLTASF